MQIFQRPISVFGKFLGSTFNWRFFSKVNNKTHLNNAHTVFFHSGCIQKKIPQKCPSTSAHTFLLTQHKLVKNPSQTAEPKWNAINRFFSKKGRRFQVVFKTGNSNGQYLLEIINFFAHIMEGVNLVMA